MHSLPFWLSLAVVAIIIEINTGTLYLLVLAVGALAGAASLWLCPDAGLAPVSFALGALATLLVVQRLRRRRQNTPDPQDDLDLGGQVELVRLPSGATPARVRYRGSEWDAELTSGNTELSPGQTGHIIGHTGNRLHVRFEEPKYV